MRKNQLSKKEEHNFDVYLKNNGVKPLQRIFTKLTENNQLPMDAAIINAEGEREEKDISEIAMYSPTVMPGAGLQVTDMRDERNGVSVYDFAMINQAGYEKTYIQNLGIIVDGMKDEQAKGVKQVLVEYKEQIEQLLAYDRDMISGYLANNISKLNIAATIEFFNRIYKEYPEKKELIAKALGYVIADTKLIEELFVEKDSRYGGRKFISFNPQLNAHMSLHETMYNMPPQNNPETNDVNHFMGMLQSRIAFVSTEMTAALYDTMFKILARIELMTHGMSEEDLGYDWIMNCLDKTGFEVFSQYHDSLLDMMMFTVLKVNALYYNYGTFEEARNEITKILRGANRAILPEDDEYYYD